MSITSQSQQNITSLVPVIWVYLTYAKILLGVQFVSGPGGLVRAVPPGRGGPRLGEGRQQRHGGLRHRHVAARVVPRGGLRAPHQRQPQEVRQGLAGDASQALVTQKCQVI